MSKETRQIVARGLTKSDIGSTISWADTAGRFRTVVIDNVSYAPISKATVVQYHAVAELRDDQLITVVDA